MEIWKDIRNFRDGYQISNLGRVKSLERVITRKNGVKQTIRERVLKTHVSKTGYEFAVIQNGAKSKHFAVHRLVSLAFIPNPKEKRFVNHLDGVKTNNNVQNLEWCTKSENERHAFKTGLKSHKGMNHNQRKLDKKKVCEIIKLRGKETGRAVAKKYGVQHSCIFAIWNNRTWQEIPR